MGNTAAVVVVGWRQVALLLWLHAVGTKVLKYLSNTSKFAYLLCIVYSVPVRELAIDARSKEEQTQYNRLLL